VIGSIIAFVIVIFASVRLCCRKKSAPADSSSTYIQINPQTASAYQQPQNYQQQQQSYQAPPPGFQQPYQAAPFYAYPGAPSPQGNQQPASAYQQPQYYQQQPQQQSYQAPPQGYQQPYPAAPA
jgi:hypothetical protein